MKHTTLSYIYLFNTHTYSISNLHLTYLYILNCLFCILFVLFCTLSILYICILLFLLSVLSCHSVALLSFCHQNKFLACANILCNKAHSDSEDHGLCVFFFPRAPRDPVSPCVIVHVIHLCLTNYPSLSYVFKVLSAPCSLVWC